MDSNYERFVEEHGTDCAELDARPPDAPRERLIRAVESYITDSDAWKALAGGRRSALVPNGWAGQIRCASISG
jgi:hypothetical protein